MGRSRGGDAGPELIGCLDMQETADLESLKNSLSGEEGRLVVGVSIGPSPSTPVVMFISFL